MDTQAESGNVTQRALSPVTAATPEVEVEQLVLDVYEAAPPETRRRMLAAVFTKAFNVVSGPAKASMLTRLLRPLGLLSLLTVANGVFARMPWAAAPELSERVLAQGVAPGDVMSLAEWVQQVNFDAFRAVADMLVSAPELAGSSLGIVLLLMLARHRPLRRSGDEA